VNTSYDGSPDGLGVMQSPDDVYRHIHPEMMARQVEASPKSLDLSAVKGDSYSPYYIPPNNAQANMDFRSLGFQQPYYNQPPRDMLEMTAPQHRLQEMTQLKYTASNNNTTAHFNHTYQPHYYGN